MRRGLAALLLGACTFSVPGQGGDGGGDGNGDAQTTPPEVDLVTLSGTVVDYLTGDPVTVSDIEGVDLSGGEISFEGSTFTVSGILPFSIFRLEVAAPTHETTISALLEVGEEDVDGAVIEIVPPSLVDDAYDSADRERSDGLIIATLIDASSGSPMAGVAEDAFSVGEVIRFVDTSGAVSRSAPASLDAGIAMLLNVAPGLVSLVSMLPEHVFIAPQVRVKDSVVTLVNIDVGLEPPPLPTGVTFEDDVVGVFAGRGCMWCHSDGPFWNPPNGFDLNAPMDERYDLVMARVNLEDPEASLLLRKPSFEYPRDNHQIVFANKYDEDRMILEAWILDGSPR